MARLLFVNQFYPPDDAPTGRALADVAARLASRGHEVEVLASRRRYGGGPLLPASEILDGVKVTRLGGSEKSPKGKAAKIASYAGYYLRVSAKMTFAGKKPDLICTLTTPPYLGLAARPAAFLRGAARMEWVMDLYPDVMVSHGMLREGSLFFRFLRLLARLDAGGCRKVVGLSPEMAARASAYFRGAEWSPLWGDDALPALAREDADVLEMRRSRGWGGELVAMYSGNMGLGHDMRTFLSAALATGPSVRWVFCGGGPRRAEVEEFIRAHPQARVELVPYAPREKLGLHLASADVLLASVRPEWNGTLTPSKAVNAFAAGRPLLYAGPEGDMLSGWLHEGGLGWTSVPGDAAGIARLLDSLAAERSRLPDPRQIRAFYDAKLARSVACEDMARLVESVLAGC